MNTDVIVLLDMLELVEVLDLADEAEISDEVERFESCRLLRKWPSSEVEVAVSIVPLGGICFMC